MSRCTATASRTRQQCRRDAIIGATVCPMHGGRAPQVRAAAERRARAADVERAAAKYATPREDVTPSVALVEEMRRAAGLVDWLERRVRESDAPLTSAEFEKLGVERDRLTRLSADLARLGIEQSLIAGELERRTEDTIARYAVLSGRVLADALRVLGLDPPHGRDWADTENLVLFASMLLTERGRAAMPGDRDPLPWGDPMPELAPELVVRLEALRARSEAPLRSRIAELEAEVERLRSRVQRDGLSTRLALPPAPTVEPDPVVERGVVEVLEADEVIAPPAVAGAGVGVAAHYEWARRQVGFDGPGGGR